MKPKAFSTGSTWFFLYSFLNAFFACLICLSNFPAEELSWSIQSMLFSITAAFGHFGFLFLITTFPFWWLARFSKSEKLPVYLAILVNILLIITIYFDARIFELYKFHLNGMVIELITGGALQDIVAFNFLVWSLFAGIAITFILFELFLGFYLLKICEKNIVKMFVMPMLLATVLICAIVSQAIYIYSDAKGDTTITSLKRYIPWAQPITAKGRLKDLGVEVNENQSKQLNYSHKSIAYPKNPVSCTIENPYNVMVILVDSLRFDMLTKEVMPGVWKLSQQSHNFNQYFSLGNTTRFGVFTLMYGLSGNYWHSMLEAQRGSVLFDVTKENGYQHYIYSAAPLYSPEFDRTVFIEVKDDIRIGPLKQANHIRDTFVTDALVDKLDNHDKDLPFFGFIFYVSPHSYSYPPDYKEPFQPSWEKINYLELDNDFNPEKFLNRYKNAVSYSDKLVGRVTDSLKKNKLLENTIVVFTSDHGQEFNDTKQNFWGHNGNFSKYQTQVPFFIYWPESHPLHGSQTHQQLSASIDFLPTLMNQGFGCDNPIEDYSLGYDLYASQNNYARPLHLESWSKRAILGKDYVMVFHDAGGSEIFDRDYNPLTDFSPPEEDFSIIFKQLSTFRNKQNSQ